MKGRKMSKSLGNVVDPAILVEGGKNEKQEPAYGADVLRLWVSSVDYSADVPLGPGIVKQLADVYRKVRNTARYLLGNLHDFDPRPQAQGGHAIAIAALPLLDRWMLQRTAALIDAVNADFESFEFYRFFQALQNFCVVDLSNVYLDIAKDRLYVSGADSFRRRSCQTVLALVVERLAGLIAPVLCHMAEDIWQNLPYPVAEASVFERGWPTVPEHWRDTSLEAPLGEILALRAQVNRQLEACRKQGGKAAGAGAAAPLRPSHRHRRVPGSPGAAGARPRRRHRAPAQGPIPAGGQPPSQRRQPGRLAAGVRGALRRRGPGGPAGRGQRRRRDRAHRPGRGRKCERCWHYEADVAPHQLSESLEGRICGRCRSTLDG
jgi:isoleucyl-tRNA synthetase